jgi:hypothetical protein
MSGLAGPLFQLGVIGLLEDNFECNGRIGGTGQICVLQSTTYLLSEEIKNDPEFRVNASRGFISSMATEPGSTANMLRTV